MNYLREINFRRDLFSLTLDSCLINFRVDLFSQMQILGSFESSDIRRS